MTMAENADLSSYGLSQEADPGKYGLTEESTGGNAAQRLQSQIQGDVQSQKPAYRTVDVPILGNLPDPRDPAARQAVENGMMPSAEGMQRAASAALPFVAPEIRAVPYLSSMLSRIPFGSAVGNALGRIGYGAAINTAPSLFTPEGRAHLGENSIRNLMWNAGIEGATSPFRIGSAYAELTNPLKYASQKAGQIRDEYNSAIQAQNSAYAPVTQKYGTTPVTSDPGKYLGFTKKQVSMLTPQVQDAYSEFLKNPTFQNLHDFQSIAGNNWSRIANNPNKIKTAQNLYKTREAVKGKIQSFLGNDRPMLDSYNSGIDITKNIMKPYESNLTLRKVINGTKLGITPGELSNAIRQGREKIVYGRGKNAVTAIPSGHPLVNHMQDLQSRMNWGNLAGTAIPAAIGGIGGELLHPGLLGIGTGIGAGLGVSGAGALAAKFGANTLKAATMQNPKLEDLAARIAPWYYRGTRSAVGGNQ